LHLFVFTPDPPTDGERSKRDLYSFFVFSWGVTGFSFKPSGFGKRLKVVGAMVKSYFLVG